MSKYRKGILDLLSPTATSLGLKRKRAAFIAVGAQISNSRRDLVRQRKLVRARRVCNPSWEKREELRLEDQEFEDSLDSNVRPCLRNRGSG